MPVPIDPAIIGDYINFQTPSSGVPISTCSQPPEGPKCVPMQFVFPNAAPQSASYYVDMSSGSPNPPLSQCAALFIDCSNINSDISVVFADTGYSVTCPAGDTRLTPILSGKINPQFYVAPPPDQLAFVQGQVNIFALNIFIPAFESGDVFDKPLGYGDAQFNQSFFPPGYLTTYYTTNFDLGINQVSNYTAPAQDGTPGDITGYTAAPVNIIGPIVNQELISAPFTTSFYNFVFALDAMDISISAQTTDMSTQQCQLLLLTDGGVAIYSKLFQIESVMACQQIVKRENMKQVLGVPAVSGTIGAITLAITDGSGNYSLDNISGNIDININGAIISVSPQ